MSEKAVHKVWAATMDKIAPPVLVSKAFIGHQDGKSKHGFNWRFHRTYPEKIALDAGIVSDLIAGKSKSTKSLTFSQEVDIVGVFYPSGTFRTPRSLAGWQGDIRSNAMYCDADTRTAANGRRVSGWFTRCFGRPKPTLRVNAIECASWDAAYHVLGMAQRGKRNCV